MLKVDGTSYYNKKAISSEFAKYFSNIGNKLSASIPEGTHEIEYYLKRIERNPNSLFMEPCMELEIEKVLSSLKK